MFVKKCIISALLFLSYSFLYAQSIQSLDLLKSKIEQFVMHDLAAFAEGKITVTVEKMDSRLHLKACTDENLTVFNPYNTPIMNTSTMGVKCLEPENHWTLYVPVRISVIKAIYAAKRPLLKGTRIGMDDLYQIEMDVQLLKQGYYTEQEQIVGQVCKQPIAQGTPFSPYNVQLPRLVLKGQQVSILAGNEAFTVRMSGVAMNDGILGEMVSVKNLSSKRIVEAKISGNQEVRVLN